MIKINIEMVYRIIQHLEWRVWKGHLLIIAGIYLRFGDLEIGERKYRQLWAIDDLDNIVWMITVRWDREHDQFCEAFLAGDVEKLTHDWVLLKLMEEDWSMRIPIKPPSRVMAPNVNKGYTWTMGEVLSMTIHNPLTKP